MICGFDMATEANGKATGAKERTGTVQFMAREMFQNQPHQTLHICKSVYWLCPITLVWNVLPTTSRKMVLPILQTAYIWPKGASLMSSCSMLDGDKREKYLITLARLKNTVEKDLFECFIDLSEYFHKGNLESPEEAPECFKDCVHVIIKAIDKAKSEESSRANKHEEPPQKKQKQ